MAILSNPSRAQFERLLVTGQTPVRGQPGAFAVNIPDGLLWTFDTAGQPVLVGGGLQVHNPLITYRPGPSVIVGDTIYLAVTSVPAGTFDPAQWQALTASSAIGRPAPAASGLIAGGTITFVSGASVTVSAGNGIILDTGNPMVPSQTLVSWGSQTVALPAGGETFRVVTVASNGGISAQPLTSLPTIRRQQIILGYVAYDDAGNIVSIINTPQPTDQTSTDFLDLRDALGGTFKIRGGALTPRTGRSFDLAAREVYAPAARWRATPGNPNGFLSTAALTPAIFDVIRRDGEVMASSTSLVPTDSYESGPIPPGFATIHYLFAQVGSGTQHALQLGQNIYPSLPAALIAAEDDWLAFQRAWPQSDGVVVLGAVAVVANASDFTQADQARVAGVKNGPQVDLRFAFDASDDEFLRRDGTTAMTGSLDMSGFSIQNCVIDEGQY